MTTTVQPPSIRESREVSPVRAALIGLSAAPHLVCGVAIMTLVSRTRDHLERLDIELPFLTTMFISSPPLLWMVVGVLIAAGVLVCGFLSAHRKVVVPLHVAGAVLGILAYWTVWMPFVKMTEAYVK